MRGTTVVWGDYGLRMRDHDRRISAQQLKIAEDTIRKRLRGMKFIMYMRIAANIGVYTSGNDVRMGKGKGSFDRWTARVAVSKIIFEIQGDLHEQVVRDAFRLAGAKLPGEFISVLEVEGWGWCRGGVLTVSRTVRVRQEGRPPGHGRDQAGKRHHSGGPQEAAQAAAAGADGGTHPCCGEPAVGAVVDQNKRRGKESVCVIPCANTVCRYIRNLQSTVFLHLIQSIQKPLGQIHHNTLVRQAPRHPVQRRGVPLDRALGPLPLRNAPALLLLDLLHALHQIRN